MRTRTKLKVLTFLAPMLIFGSIGAGKVWDAAVAAQKAAQARELQARFETSFVVTSPPNAAKFVPAMYTPEESSALDTVVPVVKPEQLIIRNEGDFSSVKIDEESQLCLGSAIYGEARDEPHSGQTLVGLVIMARVNDQRDDFGKSVCDAVLKYQKSTNRWQFDGMKTTPSVNEKKEWLASMRHAGEILRGEYSLAPPVQQIRYFYAVSHKAYRHQRGVGKNWLVKCTKVLATVGGHHFSADNGRCDGKPTLVVAREHKHLQPKTHKVKVATR